MANQSIDMPIFKTNAETRPKKKSYSSLWDLYNYIMFNLELWRNGGRTAANIYWKLPSFVISRRIRHFWIIWEKLFGGRWRFSVVECTWWYVVHISDFLLQVSWNELRISNLKVLFQFTNLRELCIFVYKNRQSSDSKLW